MNQADIYEYLKETPVSKLPDIFIVSDDRSAKRLGWVAEYLGIEPFVLPQLRAATGEDLRSYSEEISAIFSALSAYHSHNGKKIMVMPVHTATLGLPAPGLFDSFEIEFAGELDIGWLKERLYDWGYHFVDIVTTAGEVSIRGDIVDIFSPGADRPWRISLFDEEVESISRFDPDTQKRSAEELERVEISPAFLALSSEERASLQNRVEESGYESFVKDIDSLGFWHLDDLSRDYLDMYDAVIAEDVTIQVEEIYESDPNRYIPMDRLSLPSIPTARRYRDLEVIDPNAIVSARGERRVTVIARNESVVRGSQLIDIDKLRFVYMDGVISISGPDEIIISLNRESPKRRVKRASIVLDEMRTGEYVVHETHGVGIFVGIEKRNVLGALREFVVLKYQNEDTLLVPVENLEVIDRYVADSGTLPALDRLGKASFRRLKGKVREKLFAIASEIVELSAKRLLKRGVVIERDPAVEAKFLSDAGFVHTEDQLEAIEAVLSDMASGTVMDRLLSADVGFGKTEVAMNAIFAVVRRGYQAMMIVPTTLLSSQHYRSLRERFAQWDIKVAKVDRYTTPAEKRRIMSALEDGDIDVVVGTHALLKAVFKNLALVVVDEEHKFGVKQKESLKLKAIDLHMLSMSATPIPRSLNMALSSIKSFSEILTPPLQRVGVRTFVRSYDPKIVKEAILREIRRGGQIFYVYNSIAGIESKAQELSKIVPNLRMTLLHSKISAKDTEEEMMKFEAGEYDLLLSTSIVESGIHLPNANTMIVDGAENFGIADLHQLRGRVGRGGKEGYCHFVVEDRDRLSESARRRLLALESHSELGSGAVLAFHDLEIRGGGNIIGEAQSGHIKQIGYSLYLRMLEDAIRQLSGEKRESLGSVDIKLQVDACLNDTLISEDRLRLELYRRLSLAKSVSDVYEIEEEIADRFGPPDSLTKQFIDMMVIKVMAKSLGISKVSSYGERVFIEYHDGSDRDILTAPSKDADDILETALVFLRKRVSAKES
jgi:transcription-repair coupling factor (superfamily II helicase)